MGGALAECSCTRMDHSVRRSGRRPTPDHDYCAESLDSVVRRLFGDDDVVHVPFAMTGGRHTNQLGVALKRRDIGTAAIPHARAEAADELVNHRGDAALVSNASLDPLRDQLLARFRVGVEIEFILEISIAAAP